MTHKRCLKLAPVLLLACHVVMCILVLKYVDIERKIAPLRCLLAHGGMIEERPARPEPPPKFVSLCEARLRGNHGTGNQLFMLAAMLHVARLTGRHVVMPQTGWSLDGVFDLPGVRRVKDVCPCTTLHSPNYAFDARLDNATFVSELAALNATLLICGLSQTSLHAAAVSDELRAMLRFRPGTCAAARDLLLLAQPALCARRREGASNRCVRVGVHVRGGDFLSPTEVAYGLTVVDSSFLRSAFAYFAKRYAQVQFIVATDDWRRTSALLANVTAASSVTASSVTAGSMTAHNLLAVYDVVESHNLTAAEDLALLAMCDGGVVVSTGSFGWWAAWLANRTTVYYARWPRRGSPLGVQMDAAQYFLRDWIALL